MTGLGPQLEAAEPSEGLWLGRKSSGLLKGTGDRVGDGCCELGVRLPHGCTELEVLYSSVSRDGLLELSRVSLVKILGMAPSSLFMVKRWYDESACSRLGTMIYSLVLRYVNNPCLRQRERAISPL